MKYLSSYFFFLLFLVTFNGTGLLAQDKTIKNLQDEASRTIKKDVNDTLPDYWKRGGIANLVIAQGSLSNWAAGGDEFSISINSFLNLFSFYKKDRNSWDNTFDFNFGYVNTTSLGSRKNDDRIDLLSKYGYALNNKLNLSGLINFRSQFFKGYTYDDNQKFFASAFLSPAYILVAPGLDYKPRENLSIFLSPATSRWVIVKDDMLAARGLYGVDSGKHVNYEIGAFASINYQTDLTSIINYKVRLDLFSNYRQNPKNVDMFMTNNFSVKVGKFITANYNLDLIYDDDVKLFGENNTSPGLQVKSLAGIGFQAKF